MMVMTAPVTLRQAETLVGITYVDGEFDCMHLALLAQRQLFGRDVAWPTRPHPRGRRIQAALIARHCDALAAAIERPDTGDAVLFTEPDAKGGRRYHIGTLFLDRGELWVLHTNALVGSSLLQRIGDCLRSGLRLEGYYRWRQPCAA